MLINKLWNTNFSGITMPKFKYDSPTSSLVEFSYGIIQL